MTRIMVRRMLPRYSIKAEGHAEGSPEACAGVSAILYALAGWVGNNGQPCECRLEPGDAEIWVVDTVSVRWPEVRTAFQMAEIGLRQIAKKYPEAVVVE